MLEVTWLASWVVGLHSVGGKPRGGGCAAAACKTHLLQEVGILVLASFDEKTHAAVLLLKRKSLLQKKKNKKIG